MGRYRADLTFLRPLFVFRHPELNVSLKYSTPTLFYEEMNKCTNDWEVFQPPNNDFLPCKDLDACPGCSNPPSLDRHFRT